MSVKALTGMPARVLAANLILACVALLFGAGLLRELSRQRPLPPPPAQPAAKAAREQPATSPPAEERLDSYSVIVARHLFNPSRSESGSTPAAAVVALPPKPFLHGVIVDGTASLAYLEDPGNKRIFAYRVGDSVAGGQLIRIAADRVLIRRPDGQLDVLLKDPAKPQPAAVPPPSRQEAPKPGASAARIQAAPPIQPAAPGQMPAARAPARVPRQLGMPQEPAPPVQPEAAQPED